MCEGSGGGCGGFGSCELVFGGAHQEVKEVASGGGGRSLFGNEGEGALAQGRRYLGLEKPPGKRVGGFFGCLAWRDEFVDIRERAASPANEVSGGVVADEQGGGVDPRAATLPAFHIWGLKEFLSQIRKDWMRMLVARHGNVERLAQLHEPLDGALDLMADDIRFKKIAAHENGPEEFPRIHSVTTIFLAESFLKGL